METKKQRDAQYKAELKAQKAQRKAESDASVARHKAIEKALKRWRSSIKKGDTVSIQLAYNMPDVIVTMVQPGGGFCYCGPDGSWESERKAWTYPSEVGATMRSEMERLGIEYTHADILASAVSSWFDCLPGAP